MLLFGSLFFYAWSEPVFIWVVLASAAFDWLLGKRIYDSNLTNWMRKGLVALGCASNLAILAYTKYTAFAVASLNSFLALWTAPGLAVPKIALPLGVSFIVFEKITYLVDLYRKSAKPAASLLDYLNYVFLFPKLLAGPIIKYHDIALQLRQPTHCYEDIREGLLRFIWGLSKKVLIADALSPTADAVFNLPAAQLSTGTAWLGLVCFTLQIYFDFSGYSDMAIGLGRILGFRFMENFNCPYLATSFTDFWRRWHISLSTWIKEYLYIPLGGNRVSTTRSYWNLSFCFLLSGLWHGAAWHFVLWGCLHGFILILDRAFWLRWQTMLPRFFNMGLTLFLVMLGWVFFRCTTAPQALDFIGALMGMPAAAPNGVFLQADIQAVYGIIGLGTAIVFLPLVSGPRLQDFFMNLRFPAVAGCLLLFTVDVGRMAVSMFHPFLYFRF
jgi:alginate O-acetyltransferase complex protein AlgI